MAAAAAADVAVVVSHDSFIKLLLAELLGGGVGLLPAGEDADGLLRCELLNTATTALELDPLAAPDEGAATLLWLNRVDHFLLAARL
jgi:hypothetical protein